MTEGIDIKTSAAKAAVVTGASTGIGEATVRALQDWMRAAHQFAWAHERACPRHDADAPCNCGLDEFLSRPKAVTESVRDLRATVQAQQATIATIRLAAQAVADRTFANHAKRALSRLDF